jgi:tetratricopeptide (TPR) repeat protein
MRRSILSIAIVSLLVVATSARAEDAEEAKRHFTNAQTAYKLGRYAEAISEYEAAYRALPEAAFLFNIAQAHRQQYSLDKKMGHLHQALAQYKAYLRESPEAKNRHTVEKIIEELRSILTSMEDRAQPAAPASGTLSLRGESTDGAMVTVDGKFMGQMPFTQPVTPGPHRVEVSKKGRAPWASSVNVAAGSQVELSVTLRPLRGAKSNGRSPAEAPIYKKWWFWTIAAAVVGAGVGTGVYFGTRGDSIPPVGATIDLRK